MNKNLNSAIDMIAKLATSEKQDAIFYGTKCAWLNDSCTCDLKDAFRYNDIKFTYKKDWLDALKTFGTNL